MKKKYLIIGAVAVVAFWFFSKKKDAAKAIPARNTVPKKPAAQEDILLTS